jgi:SAM-dependent methyltransferase
METPFSPFRQLALGLVSYLPPVAKLLENIATVGGGHSALYCYGVWMRHLVVAHQNSVITGVPRHVAELGPGDSLGTGIAALLSGVERYVALDAVSFAKLDESVRLLDELIELFHARAPITGNDAFPMIRPVLEDHSFPRHILTDAVLAQALAPARISRIRESLHRLDKSDSMLRYISPWMNADKIEDGAVDMIISQAALEHVDDIEGAYRAMARWVRPGGVMSHTIGFMSHGTASVWNGHWTYGDRLWTLMRGKRFWLLNRLGLSAHIRLMHDNGFVKRAVMGTTEYSPVRMDQVVPKLRPVTEEDMYTSDALILTVKTGHV